MNKPQINVTPLIDVLLVLLIIFMVITPMKPSAFDAKIPSEPKTDQPAGVDPLTLVVVMESDRTVRLNREELGASVEDASRLTERLKGIIDERTKNLVYADSTSGTATTRIERTVFIKAPRSTDYGSVAKIVDAVKMAGADPVSLQIDDLD